MAINRFEVYLVNLDPTIEREIWKTRPCLVVSPDEINHHIRTVIVARMTTKEKAYPTRVACRFGGKSGQVVLDQIRTFDQTRLTKRLGRLDAKTSVRVLEVLQGSARPLTSHPVARMANVLMTWELGAGFGHVDRLLTIARELARRGTGRFWPCRDLVGPASRLCGEPFPVLQAPFGILASRPACRGFRRRALRTCWPSTAFSTPTSCCPWWRLGSG